MISRVWIAGDALGLVAPWTHAASMRTGRRLP